MSPAEISLLAATVLFVGGHFLLSHPLRPALAGRLGEKGFSLLYSLIAFAALGWMIVAWRQVGETFPLWIAPSLVWWAGSFLMIPALVLLVGSLIRNPAFPHPGAPPTQIPPPRGVFAVTRHPMNWAFILWALVHLSVYGTTRNIIVAGDILILAFFGSIGQDRRKAAAMGAAWTDWQARTGFFPFGAQLRGKLRWRTAFLPGWIPLIAGTLLWLLITWWHAPEVSPIAVYQDFSWLLR
ncbi:MAG: NnrU family protein [Allosphingosinicella sp.]|uniref:NnrU family protein n=1 Tax=Allosphingosinicella sp. TaxID=2823234 RepID=UPI0039587939